MEQVLSNVSAPELQPAMDANLAAYWAEYGRAKGCAMQQSPDVLWFYTGVPHPLFNGVQAAALKVADCQQVLESLGKHIAARGAPAMWWIGPRSNPDALQPVLVQHGLEPLGAIPGMALDLALLAGEPAALADFTVKRVENAQQQALWARIAATGTGFSADATDTLEQIEATLNDARYKAQHRYLGYLHGKPVASSALVLNAGVAGIYAVATLAEVRHRGIGRFMTELPLHDARQLGYRVGILQASTMGYPLYQKLGFRDVCAYRVFLQSG
jgi:GNAT superfamily N-acetyltransferase